MMNVQRLVNAVDMAKKYGQDQLNAFMAAKERELHKAPEPPVSWSEQIRAGETVKMYRDEMGEGWTEICFCEYFDDELADEYYRNGQIFSQYDCTGKPFIYGIHYFKAFGGYVVVSDWALDI